jgi:catechol 2,3-dioxygenase-like lactoylglutathione lyase family enzyme
MKIKAVSGITYYVKDPKKTAAFYEKLGFLASKTEEDRISVRSNWFWVDCVRKDIKGAGAGMFVYLSVDDVDEFYKYALSKGLKPESEPQDVGINREFVLRDPDGYNIVIFKRK